MSSVHADPVRRASARPTANDRLKRLWGVHLSVSMTLSVVLIGVAMIFWPKTDIYYTRAASSAYGEVPRIVAMAVPGVQNIAPAPREIVAPALPTVDDLQLDIPNDLLVGPLPSFSDPAVDQPISPPVFTLRDEWLDYEHFAPFLVAPTIKNQREMKRFLERNYGPIVEMTGAQGVVQLHFWITEDGGVARAELAESSGSRSLDRLAMRLSRILRFSPALRLGQPVRVLVRLPITFRQI